MFEQMYYHRTKRSFEGMARNAAIALMEEGKFDYPSLKRLKEQSIRKEFSRIDDRWFLHMITNSSNSKVNRIGNMIVNRVRYKLLRDSSLLKNKTGEVEDVASGSGTLNVLGIVIRNSLKRLRIDKSSIIFDEFRNVPYKLRPYSSSYTESEDPATVMIYNQNLGTKKPIESMSIIVRALASNSVSTRRIYVEPNKYDKLEKFLEEYTVPLS